MTSRLLRPLRSVIAALGVAILLVAAASPAEAQTVAWVDTGGDCLQMRTAPGLDSSNIDCLAHGARITLLDETVELDGFTWQEMEYEGAVGWVADFYITTNEDDVQDIFEPEPAGPGGSIPAPPEGGLTMGVATSADPAALIATLAYPVTGVWYLDIDAQAFLQFVPGAPAFVNTLASIPDGGVVTIRREGILGTTGAVPKPSLTVAGTPNQLPTPPIGGITQGVSGTTDPRFLDQAQPFTVESISYFHVDSQQWLVYLPGAPAYVNSLQQGHLRVDGVVSIRRGPDDPNRAPSSADSTYFETSITYYYCVPGDNPASIGDAGGYCGTMANGERVHEGAAACSPGLLGQRFTIEGDPTERVYTCTDTGGSVLQDHRDIWFMHSDDGYEWWQQVGERAYVHILPDAE